MSLTSGDARVWCGDDDQYYKYLIFTDAVARFDVWSLDTARKNPRQDPRGEYSPVYDAKEVFPRDLDNQTISPDQIIGSYLYITRRPGVVFQEDYTFVFNKDFFAYQTIKPFLETHGMQEDGSFPHFTIKANGLDSFLVKIRRELGKIAIPSPVKQDFERETAGPARERIMGYKNEPSLSLEAQALR